MTFWSGFETRAGAVGANRVVLALAVARMGDAIGNSVLMIVLPLYVAVLPAPDVPVSETLRVGFLLGIYGVVATLVQPLTGIVSDRLGRRKALIQWGLLIMSITTLAFDFAGSFRWLLVLRAAQGFGVALTVPAAMALLTTGTVQESRGGSMGIYTTARMTGLAVGPLVGGALHDWLGFGAAFFFGAAATALGMLVVHLLVAEPRDGGHAARRAESVDKQSHFLDGRILALGFATAIMSAAFTIMATLETQFNARLQESAFSFSLAFSALMVTRLIFQIPLGRLSDRIGRKPVAIAGLVLLAPSTALLGLAGDTWQLAGLRLVQGLAAAAIAAPAFALASDLAHGGHEARQMSVVTSGFTLGLALGPLLAGGLAPIWFHLPFAVGGALCLAAAGVLGWCVPETVRRDGKG